MSFIRRVSSFQHKKKKNEEVRDEEWVFKTNKKQIQMPKSPEKACNTMETEQNEIKPKKLAELPRRKSFSLENLGLLEAMQQNQQFLKRKEMFNNNSESGSLQNSPEKLITKTEVVPVDANRNYRDKSHAAKNSGEILSNKSVINANRNQAIRPQTLWENVRKEYITKQQRLAKTKSISLENVCDSFESKRNNDRPRIKFDSHQQLDKLEKLLSTFDNEENKQITIEKTRPFPVDENVEIRKTSIARDGIVRSKTLHIDTLAPAQSGTGRLERFDVPGPVKIEIAQDCCIPVKKNDRLRFENGELKKIMTDGLSINNFQLLTVRRNIQFQGIHPLSKKEIQLTDTTGKKYKIIFEDAKAAKHFIDEYGIGPNSASEKMSIKFMLRRFLNKRSSREQLESKGIIRDEPIFGNTLENIYNVNHQVPEFIIRTVDLIERPENIRTMGLYRTSGNLATIQKIRLQVDAGRLDILNEYEKDVDVLTGSLKLFFRELKKPLLPCEVSEELYKIKDSEKNSSVIDKVFKIIHRLPQANRETLIYLIRHLLKVAKYKDDNKMDIHNISVCWSPSIFAIPEDCQNILTFTTTAAKSLEFLLDFYDKNSKELGSEIGKDMNEAPRKLQRQESKDSLVSNESSQSKNAPIKMRTLSESYVNEVQKVVKKVVELVELNIGSEDLYKSPGTPVKVEKCHKKMLKKKLSDLDKYAKDVHDLTGALKRYIRDLQEPLISKEIFDDFCKICDNTDNARQQKEMILPNLETMPQIEILKFLLEHLRKVIENDTNKVTANDIREIWTGILTYNCKECTNNQRYRQLISIIFDVYVSSHFVSKTKREPPLLYGMPDVIKEVQSRHQRASSYDNVPEIPELRKD